MRGMMEIAGNQGRNVGNQGGNAGNGGGNAINQGGNEGNQSINWWITTVERDENTRKCVTYKNIVFAL